MKVLVRGGGGVFEWDSLLCRIFMCEICEDCYVSLVGCCVLGCHFLAPLGYRFLVPMV
jgi:hypothetical protein